MSLRHRLAEAAVFASACVICFANVGAQTPLDIRKLDQRPASPPAPMVKPRPQTETAKRATKLLDEIIEFGSVEVTVAEFEAFLQEKVDEVGVFVDARGLKVAGVGPEELISVTVPSMPLRAALRKMLSPLALKVVVDDDGLVVTADYAELARRGIATSRWTQGAGSANAAIMAKMDQSLSVSAVEEPLSQFIAGLSRKLDIPMLVDARALEEIGLHFDEPVSLQLQNVSLRAALRLALRELDLTYQIADEVLMVTTIEAAEMNLINRIYFMEGFGDPSDAGKSMSKVITASIVPDTWEQLGGPSTIIPLIADERPAILASTTSDVHDLIMDFLESLRKAGSTESPKVDVPAEIRR